MDKIYVMTTDWKDHWDKITHTSYTKKVIHLKREDINSQTTTIFIKIRDKNTATIEHIYKGHISDISFERNKVWFKVNLEERLSILPNYINWEDVKAPGWYVVPVLEDQFLPPFVRNLANTSNWQEFENGVFVLLKLLGITNVHKYITQRGLPDGVFKIKNLVVVYDATLDTLDKKQGQIQNYVNLLKENKFKVTEDEIWDISGCTKQVWIITKSDKTKLIRREDDIFIKEVTISDLIDLLVKRLKYLNREDELVGALSRL